MMESPLISVRDVWRGALPEGTELLGGGTGLERRVEWATPLRTRPPAFEAIKGGELALVPVAAIRQLDERLGLDDVMNSLAEKGGVAVAILGDAPTAALAVAERRHMPLLRLPDGAHVADVQQAVVRFVVEQRTLLHERSQVLQTELMQLALGGAGSDAIIARLAELTGHAAAWQDGSERLRSLSGEVPEAVRTALDTRGELQRWLAGRPVTAADPPVDEFDLPRGRMRLAAPIPGRDGVLGFVSLIGQRGALGQLERLAVNRAASACSIELDRERAVLRARDDIEGELVVALVEGAYGSDAGAIERARRLEFDLSGSSVVVVVRSNGTAIETTAAAARRVVTRYAPGAMVTTHQGSVCVVAAIDGERLATMAMVLHGDCAGTTTEGAAVGIGRHRRGPSGVRQSYREAEQALRIGARLRPPRRVAAFADLGLHRLLVAMTQHPELDDFYRETAGPLIDYDRRSHTDLMRTLDAFFRCNASPTETAQVLHLHRNTVLYRLRRIEEIGALRLDDPQTRLNLHLCLRIMEVLPTVETEAVSA